MRQLLTVVLSLGMASRAHAAGMAPDWPHSALYSVAGLLVLIAVLLGWLAWTCRRNFARHKRRHAGDERLPLALWASGDRYWDFDLQNERVYRVYGDDGETGARTTQEMGLDEWRRDQIHPDDFARAKARFTAHIRGETDRLELEMRIRDRHGEWRWVRTRGRIIEHDADGKPSRMAGTIRDIHAYRTQRHEHRIGELVLQSMTEAVAVTDTNFHFVSVNAAFTRVIGYSQAEIEGRETTLLNCSQHSLQRYGEIREAIREDGTWRGELWQRRKDGREFLSWMEVNVAHNAQGEPSHHVFVMTDITERKRTEQELRYLANYDSLSGLPNRTKLHRDLEAAVRDTVGTRQKVAVLFIDLDHFKHVNDAMGHVIGDRLLASAGARLRDTVGSAGMVARLGGDEFCILLDNIYTSDQAGQLADGLVEAFDQPLLLDDGQRVIARLSLGIALYPEHGSSADELLKFADAAMYQAKANGRGTWALYNASLEARARRHADMVNALRQALGNGELYVVYQPQLDLATWRITGVEALLRWHNRLLGSIPPATFIPLAEENGLIADIGEFVLDEAFAALTSWHEYGIRGVSVAVNISPAQLLSTRLKEYLALAIGAGRVDPTDLVLELTESLAMTRTGTSLANLDALRALGPTIAIDDFGTGYSSLAYLKRLPVDLLKIDKEFVNDVTHNPDVQAITKAITQVGHALELEVIAEGVETTEQLRHLQANGCDVIQGNWLSLPISAPDCLALMRHHDPARRPLFSAAPVSSYSG